jgi:hypothetical protein
MDCNNQLEGRRCLTTLHACTAPNQNANHKLAPNRYNPYAFLIHVSAHLHDQVHFVPAVMLHLLKPTRV